MIHIAPYAQHHEEDIRAFMKEIASEFATPISNPNAAPLPLPSPYWVALREQTAVGTVGLNLLASDTVALRRMFLSSAHRGKAAGVSGLLMQTALDWCRVNKIKHIYLGTMEQFKGAQRFYEKNVFTKVPLSSLPANFPLNPVDTVFYYLHLNTDL